MPKNPYFPSYSLKDATLHEDLIIEATRIYGHDVYYIPAKIQGKDRILNDILSQKFDEAFETEIYIESVDSFEGEGKLIAKFGLEIRDSLQVSIARRRWEQLVRDLNSPPEIIRPNEGDLIYFPLVKGLFEVRYVSSINPFYQLSNLPVYRMTLELYEFSSKTSKIETGIKEIDELMVIGSNGQTVAIHYDSPSELFAKGDKVFFELPSGITGESVVLRKDEVEGKIFLANPIFNDSMFHRIVTGTSITNETGTATGTLEVTSSPQASENDRSARNEDLQQEAEAIVDFSENNPFGDIRF